VVIAEEKQFSCSANFSVVVVQALTEALRHNYWVFLTQSCRWTKMLTFL